MKKKTLSENETTERTNADSNEKKNQNHYIKLLYVKVTSE